MKISPQRGQNPAKLALENPRSLVNSVEFARDLSDCAALRKMIAARLDDSDLPWRWRF